MPISTKIPLGVGLRWGVIFSGVSNAHSQFRMKPDPRSQREQHVQAEVLYLALEQARYAGLGDAKVASSFGLRPATLPQLLGRADHDFGAQLHYLGLGRLKTEVEEDIAAAFGDGDVVHFSAPTSRL